MPEKAVWFHRDRIVDDGIVPGQPEGAIVPLRQAGRHPAVVSSVN